MIAVFIGCGENEKLMRKKVTADAVLYGARQVPTKVGT